MRYQPSIDSSWLALTEIESSGPWQQPPYSEFVFFGQKLDHVALRHQLERCVISQVSPESLDRLTDSKRLTGKQLIRYNQNHTFRGKSKFL